MRSLAARTTLCLTFVAAGCGGGDTPPQGGEADGVTDNGDASTRAVPSFSMTDGEAKPVTP